MKSLFNQNFLFIFLLISFLLSSCTPKFQPGKSENSAHEIHINKIEKYLYPVYNIRGQENPKSITAMMQEKKITGLSIAFVENGKIAWTKCYGYADLKDSAKVTPYTVFRAASLSKPITAMTALHLVEKGQLDLDQDINEKLIGWKLPMNEFTIKQKVTLSHLIGHSSGIRNGIHDPIPADKEIPELEDIFTGKVLNTPAEVIFVPGEKNKYSNIGYMVLSELLSDVTSKDFNSLVDEVIFTPCGMKSSTFNQDLPKELKDRLAVGHNEFQQPIPFYKHSSSGAGALYTTPSDLGKFLANILDAYHQKTSEQKIISHEMAKKVFEENNKKLGFNKNFWNGNFVFRNDGSIPGYNCILMGSVPRNQAVVLMLNTGSEEAYDFLNYLWRSISLEYNWGLFEPEFYDKKELGINELQKFTGLYTNTKDSIRFEIKDQQLQIKDQSLIPVSKKSFVHNTVPLKYEFELDSIGIVKTVHLRNERGDRFSSYYKD